MSKLIVMMSMVLTIAASAPVEGQLARERPAGKPDYDPASETTVRGTIVRTYGGPYGELFIVEISVANRALQLFLAPPAVMKKQGFVFDKGAVIEAIGMPGFKVKRLAGSADAD